MLYSMLDDAIEYTGKVMFAVSGLSIIVGTGLPIYHLLKWGNFRAAYYEYHRRRGEAIAERDRALEKLKRARFNS